MPANLVPSDHAHGQDNHTHLVGFILPRYQQPLSLRPPSPTQKKKTSTMSIPSAIPRTAPIAIAPKPSRFARQQHQDSSSYSGSFANNNGGFDTPDSAGSPAAGFPAWPCEACQTRRIQCVMNDDDDACQSCRARGTECSLVGSPPPRKRKLHGDYSESRNKRG